MTLSQIVNLQALSRAKSTKDFTLIETVDIGLPSCLSYSPPIRPGGFQSLMFCDESARINLLRCYRRDQVESMT
jgi:hypothetical protein